MNLILWKIGTDFKAKRGANAGGIVRLFVFKDMETEKEYKMNLPLAHPVAKDWLHYAQVGNIFHGCQAQGLHPNNVDYFKRFNTVTVKEKYRGSVKSNY